MTGLDSVKWVRPGEKRAQTEGRNCELYCSNRGVGCEKRVSYAVLIEGLGARTVNCAVETRVGS